VKQDVSVVAHELTKEAQVYDRDIDLAVVRLTRFE